MPEYLAPGVFVEEVSFRSKSIEGVATSTTGFAGMTQWGPVCYRDADIDGPHNCEPRLITSFTEFERVYGGLEPLAVGAAAPGTERVPYLAHAARVFFENGGKRLYVSRVFTPRGGTGEGAWGIARRSVNVAGTDNAVWTARWPGELGNMFVETEIVRSKNIAYSHADFGVQAQRVKAGSVVEVIAGAATDPTIAVPDGNDSLTETNLRVVQIDSEGQQSFHDMNNGTPAISTDDVIQLVEMRVRVVVGSDRIEEFEELSADPSQRRYIGRILNKDDPEDQDAPLYLDWDPTAATFVPAVFLPARLMMALQSNNNGRLENGHDGLPMTATGENGLEGRTASPDDPLEKGKGLGALADIDDVSIVAAPDSGDMDGGDASIRAAADLLMSHARSMRYRIAVIDGPIGASLNQMRDFRGQFDSKYAATYYPWIKVLDPTERVAQGSPPRQLFLPPSGFICGIYARNDVERGVHKAPANEVIYGLTQFEVNINKGRNEVINPEGINALRFFDGRGYRVWGARTMSSDPEWKYVNVRRLFNFIEHSIDKGTQWAVFEPNNQRLWDNIRRTIEDFLLVQWRDGALLGAKPEEAYFVRCDRTTMTQNDLDNGRLICLIGIAPVKPAEFVIFRIGQWTGDATV